MSITFKKGFITFDFILASLVCLALLSSMIQYAKGLEDTSDIHLFRATTKAYAEHTAHLINTAVADQIGQVDTDTTPLTRWFVLGDRLPFPVAADYNLHSCFVWMEDSGSGSKDTLVVKTMVKPKDAVLNEHPDPSNTFKYPDMADNISSYTVTVKTPVTSLATLYNAKIEGGAECESSENPAEENNWCFCNALKIKSVATV
ncbi:MAG: hypothetical protein J7K00_05545 [Candidatus Diapherotrites archaeon]|nr:hypothetical protein [Candidatus Diapherotrites archaeon]